MNTSETLYRAADLIEQRGWQGPGHSVTGVDPWGFDATTPVCIEGALAAAAGLGRVTGPTLLSECPAARAVAEYLQLSDDERLWVWNDSVDHTGAEVIEVLRAAAVIEAARESETAQVSA